MSCQQVPRLPEDPYTFTEPPATAKYFSSQSHKLQFSLHHQPQTILPSSPSDDDNPTAAAAAASSQQPIRLLLPSKKLHTNGNAQALPKRNGPIYGKTASRQPKLQPPSEPIFSSTSSPAHVFSQQTRAPPPPPPPPASSTTAKIGARNHMATAASTITTATASSHQDTSATAALKADKYPTLKFSATRIASPTAAELVSTQRYPATTSAATCIMSIAPAHGSHSRHVSSSGSSPKATSPLAAQLPPTPPSSSPLYSTHYTAAQHVAGHGGSSSSSISGLTITTQTHLIHSSADHVAVQPPATMTPSTASQTPPVSTGVSVRFAKPAHSSSTASTSSLPSSASTAAKQTVGKAKRQPPANSTSSTTAVQPLLSALPPPQKRGSKRSYSQSTHHEALQRIVPPRASVATTAPIDHALPPAAAAAAAPPPPPPTPPATPAVIVSFIRNTAVTRIHANPLAPDWHAPGAELFDLGRNSPHATGGHIGQLLCVSPPPPPLHVQQCWFHPRTLVSQVSTSVPSSSTATATRPNRAQRLHDRLQQLQGQSRQLRSAQLARTSTASLKRMSAVNQTLVAKQRLVAAEAAANAATRCALATCTRTALLLASHCAVHITLDARQRLFSECTAKFANNSQCRRPAVFGARAHEMPLCREHAWKRDNYTRIVQEQKQPRKIVQRKKTAKATSVTATAAAAARRQRTSTAKKQKQLKQQQQPSATLQNRAKSSPSLLATVGQLPSLPATIVGIDTNSNSSFIAQHTDASSTSMLMGQSPPSTLNHFTISSNDSFVSSNDATNFAGSAIGSGSALKDSTGGITSNDMGATSCTDYDITDSLQAIGYAGDIHQAHPLHQSASTLCGDTPQQQFFQPQQFQQQQFQQPQNVFAYGQQYHQQQQQQQQQQTVFMTSSYASHAGHGQFFSHSQHSQNSSDSAATTPAMHSAVVSGGGGGASVTRLTDTMFTMSENSSAYESSEDTGLGGGLSETEQQLGVGGSGDGMHDDMHEDEAVAILGGHVDLNNVLSQLNTNVFEDIFSAEQQLVYKPTQEEDELIDRALEAANSQVISLTNMARDFFSDILDVDDEILDCVAPDMDVDDCTAAINALGSGSGSSSAAVAKVATTAVASTSGSMLVQPNGGGPNATASLDVRGMLHT